MLQSPLTSTFNSIFHLFPGESLFLGWTPCPRTSTTCRTRWPRCRWRSAGATRCCCAGESPGRTPGRSSALDFDEFRGISPRFHHNFSPWNIDFRGGWMGNWMALGISWWMNSEARSMGFVGRSLAFNPGIWSFAFTPRYSGHIITMLPWLLGGVVEIVDGYVAYHSCSRSIVSQLMGVRTIVPSHLQPQLHPKPSPDFRLGEHYNSLSI